VKERDKEQQREDQKKRRSHRSKCRNCDQWITWTVMLNRNMPMDEIGVFMAVDRGDHLEALPLVKRHDCPRRRDQGAEQPPLDKPAEGKEQEPIL
jgi:hypothetical protein